MIKPLFIFSLPRSGSTLLQRILSSREEIDTAAEPWILLPLMYGMKTRGIAGEYSHKVAGIGTEDFIRRMEGSEEAFYSDLGRFVLGLYQRASRKKEARYFLDKTPRYHLIVEDIIKTFPDGKFIFLWRNPLSVIASMSNTWDAGKWNLHRLEIDIYRGAANLLAACEAHRSRSFSLRYEDLSSQDGDVWPELFQYLEIPYDGEGVGINNDAVRGRLGDKSGLKAYDRISRESDLKWKQWVCNPLRKKWCKNYIEWLGEKRISGMGYSMDDLLEQLDNVPVGSGHIASDAFRHIKGRIRGRLFDKMLHMLYERI